MGRTFKNSLFVATKNMANLYYETAPYIGISGKENIRGVYTSKSHGYSTHAGEDKQNKVSLYFKRHIKPSIAYAYANIGDQVASNVWKCTSQFGKLINAFFEKQFSPYRSIAIGTKNALCNVHSMHLSKNSRIKPHIDNNDIKASIITWFNNGTRSGGQFGAHALWYKFDTSNNPGVFIKSETVVHGTLSFDPIVDEVQNYRIGLALVNKKGICTRVLNQIKEGDEFTMARDYWITNYDELHKDDEEYKE